MEKKTEFAKIGNIVKFGSYPQEAGRTQPIEWVVLDVKEGRSLLISRYALDVKEYNGEGVDVTWETCTLRGWLNLDFLKTAFTEEERNRIPIVEISTPDNDEYKIPGGENTKDKVFLLSINEVENYFENYKDRICMPTKYALAKTGSRLFSYGGAGCWWWLRSPGNSSNFAASVSPSGFLGGSCYGVDGVSDGVRPALWVNF